MLLFLYKVLFPAAENDPSSRCNPLKRSLLVLTGKKAKFLSLLLPKHSLYVRRFAHRKVTNIFGLEKCAYDNKETKRPDDTLPELMTI